jgi:integrase
MSDRKFRFTKKRLETIQKPQNRTRYYDDAVEGLIIDVTPNHVMSFRVYKWIASENRPITITLGKFPNMTIEQARTHAKKHLLQISDGKNPVQEKKAKIKEEYTLSFILTDYIEKRKLKDSTVRGYKQAVNCYFKNFKDKPFKMLDEQTVKSIHAEVSKKSQAQADLAMRVLRALFNFAKYEYRGSNNEIIFKENPVQILSHLRNWNHVPRKQTRISKSKLNCFFSTIDDFRREAELTDDLFTSSVCDFAEMAILTGLRKSELLNLTWDAINLSERSYFISKTKNGTPLELPISDRLFTILRRRLAQKTESDYIFNSYGQYGRVVEPKKVIAKIGESAGIDFTLHDLRRTFTTTAEGLNVGTYTIKRLLNHKTKRDDVTAGYTVLTPEELREPAQAIEEEILTQAEVIPKKTGVTEQINKLLNGLSEVERRKVLSQLRSLSERL